MWQSIDELLALLELFERGLLKRRQSQAVAWKVLDEVTWTKRTGRRDEIGLVESRRSELVVLLDRAWPAWREQRAELIERGLPPTPEGWSALEDSRRAEALPELPAQLNRRTAAALVGPHSKSGLTPRRLAALGKTKVTHDGSVRIRAPAGVIARSPAGVLELASMTDVLGEVSLPERALARGLELGGRFRAVLLVENLGTFRDLPLIEKWVFAHAPGWNTVTTRCLLERLNDIRLVHFGDLDPNGVRIYQHLRDLYPSLKWFVPSFWGELVESKGHPVRWPKDLELGDAPELVRQLAERNLWLEQEPLAVDPRTLEALAAMF